MRILVFGATGMLGHVACAEFAAAGHEVFAVSRSPLDPGTLELIPEPRRFQRWHVSDTSRTRALMAASRPDVVLNAVGVIKQSPEIDDAEAAARVNGLFPHELARLCSSVNAKLVQISTDCVFSGRAGGYRETSFPDPVDEYGKTKLLGEVHERPHLTLRTSMIGRELSTRRGLLEWFMEQRGGSVSGFTNAIFSGLTCRCLAKILLELIQAHGTLSGIYHLASSPISKRDLLALINEKLGLDVEIVPDERLRCDRSLNGSALRERTGICVPSWDEMISALALEFADGCRT